MAFVTKKSEERELKLEVSQTSSSGAGSAPPGPIVQASGVRPGLPPKVDYRVVKAERKALGKSGFFHIYKSGQGYWTRMGTVGGAALIGVLCAVFLYNRFAVWAVSWRPVPTTLNTQESIAFAQNVEQFAQRVAYGVTGGFFVLYSLFCVWLMNRPKVADFLIITDSEMKKVNWTNREDLMGSTKVVIMFVFLIAVLLFVIDRSIAEFFYLIHVLKVPF